MSQDHEVDLNKQIRLMRVPTEKYPQEESDVFQIKVVPPTPIDQIKEGEVVLRNLYISIDATMRVWISGVQSYLPPVKPQDVMRAQGVGEVIFSRSKKFKVGDKVLGLTGWQKYAVLKQKQINAIPSGYPNPEHFLGVLGISGLTAYFGLHKIGKIKSKEIVVISAAAGAVGEIAIQIAKYEGCIVCAISGSQQKCDYTRSIGADYTINYRTENIKKKLKQFFPEGIDVYFDNVGGEMLDDIIMTIRNESRIVLCGLISTYGKKEQYRLKNYSRLIVKRALMQGFLYFDYYKQFPKAIGQLMKMISEGKLNTRIDMCNGLDECPGALKKLLMGKNDGKVIVRVHNKLQQSPSAKL